MKMIGKSLSIKLFVVLYSLCIFFSAHAELRSNIDRSELSLDETLSLKISTTRTDGAPFSPKFNAPDFEILNQFENSQYSAVYVNGRFENKSEKSITFILHPKKSGTLRITQILDTGSQEKTTDITVQVTENSGPPRQNIQGDRPNLNSDQKNFFLKSEINKTKAYKGEQLIVSYYLYRRTRANLRDVLQYPTFQGFIREDLEMPILSGRPDFEAVSLGGIPFERALLARYALYPIREGKLKIDSLAVRADYIPRNEATDDLMEDPFFQFFSQVTPRTASSRSDPLNIEVLPLPVDGRTQIFSGGVGDFEVSASGDSIGSIQKNAPFTLRISVKGKGNSSLIDFPTVSWPKTFKFYESQGKSKNLGGGSTEKTFEVILVPLEEGPQTIPSIEFEFFNPETRSYSRKKTNPISITVLPGDGRSAAPTQVSVPDEPDSLETNAQIENKLFGSVMASKNKDTINPDGNNSFLGQPWWKWVAWGGLLVFLSFIGLIAYDQLKKRSKVQLDLIKRKQNDESFWSGLKSKAEEFSSINDSAERAICHSQILDELIDHLHQVIDDSTGLSSRAISRRDLAKKLTEEHQVPKELWVQVEPIFEIHEGLRFAQSFQSSSDGQTLKNQIDAAHDFARFFNATNRIRHT